MPVLRGPHAGAVLGDRYALKWQPADKPKILGIWSTGHTIQPQLISFEPRLAVLGQVDGPDGTVEGFPERDLPEAGSQAPGRIDGEGRPLVDHPPAEGVQLVEQRFSTVWYSDISVRPIWQPLYA